ncbi:RNA polymerase sigma factor, partial [Gemmatimonadota bacterium]
ELVYTRHADLLFAYICHRMNGARTDAEDVWQETLLAMLDSLPTFKGDGRLFTWMCGIARHKIADHFQRSVLPASESTGRTPDRLVEHISAEPSPDQMLITDVSRAVVIETLASLPETYRLVLIARYADGKSTSDVAKMIHRTYKATESLLSRARFAFRERFEQLEEWTDGT